MLGDLSQQIYDVWKWSQAMQKSGATLLLADGNHDFNSEVLFPLAAIDSSPEWQRFCEKTLRGGRWLDSVWSDCNGPDGPMTVAGQSKLIPELGNLVVTSLKHGIEHADANRFLLVHGRILRKDQPGRRWLVVTHEPPVGLLGDSVFGSEAFSEIIEEFQPNIVVCGHDHYSPHTNDTCCERIGLTRVYNAGFRKQNKTPCCIEIDLDRMRHRWIR